MSRINKNQKPQSTKVTYFPFEGAAEPIRLALHIGGIPFDDERIPFDKWPEFKTTTPFGQMPLLEIDGDLVTQAHAILRWAGKLTGLYPTDFFDAMKCDEALDAMIDINSKIAPTMSYNMPDEEQRKKKRAELNDTVLPDAFGKLDKLLGKNNGGGFIFGGKMTIADLRLSQFARWLKSGILDGVSPDILEQFANIMTVVKSVDADPKVVEWREAHAKK